MNFETVVDRIYTRVNKQNDRVLPYIREAVIRTLRDISHLRLPWMESTFSFTTTAGVTEYDSATTGFAADIAVIDVVRRSDVGGSVAKYPLAGPFGIADLRDAQVSGESLLPRQWGFHHNKLLLAPGCGQALILEADYQRDATRDTATGDLITVDSTTHTNPWFVEGQTILLNYVLADVHGGLFVDTEAAASAFTLAQQGLGNMKQARTSKQDQGAQAICVF